MTSPRAWSPLLRCPACGKGGLPLRDPRCDACGQAAEVDDRILIFGVAPTVDYSAETAAVLQADVADQHVWFQLRTAVILDATQSFRSRGCLYG